MHFFSRDSNENGRSVGLRIQKWFLFSKSFFALVTPQSSCPHPQARPNIYSYCKLDPLVVEDFVRKPRKFRQVCSNLMQRNCLILFLKIIKIDLMFCKHLKLEFLFHLGLLQFINYKQLSQVPYIWNFNNIMTSFSQILLIIKEL